MDVFTVPRVAKLCAIESDLMPRPKDTAMMVVIWWKIFRDNLAVRIIKRMDVIGSSELTVKRFWL